MYRMFTTKLKEKTRKKLNSFLSAMDRRNGIKPRINEIVDEAINREVDRRKKEEGLK